MSKNKKKEDFEDDGRVIAPMNVDGMPWYDSRKFKTEGEEEADSDGDTVRYKDLSPEEKKEYRKNTRRIIWGIMKYIIPLALIGSAIFGLFIYLLTLVWQ